MSYVIAGALIYRFPVACPLIALIIYVLSCLILLLMDPISAFKGIIWKILVIGAMIKAINSGSYYRRSSA